MATNLVTIASCLGLMKGRHQVISVRCQDRSLPKAVLTVTLGIKHWVLELWYLRIARLAILDDGNVVLKSLCTNSSASYNCVLILNTVWKLALVSKNEFWQSS